MVVVAGRFLTKTFLLLVGVVVVGCSVVLVVVSLLTIFLTLLGMVVGLFPENTFFKGFSSRPKALILLLSLMLDSDSLMFSSSSSWGSVVFGFRRSRSELSLVGVGVVLCLNKATLLVVEVGVSSVVVVVGLNFLIIFLGLVEVSVAGPPRITTLLTTFGRDSSGLVVVVTTGRLLRC